jgi:hypothetical protein
MAAPITLSTTFSLDDIGRYVCNTLDEATASQDLAIHSDARPFDFIVIGEGVLAPSRRRISSTSTRPITTAF